MREDKRIRARFSQFRFDRDRGHADRRMNGFAFSEAGIEVRTW